MDDSEEQESRKKQKVMQSENKNREDEDDEDDEDYQEEEDEEASNNDSEQFVISSGALCFGTNNNIRHGATQPIQTPSFTPFVPGGTVLAHCYEMNLAAVNGTWKTFPLVTSSSASGDTTPVAWFACHEEHVSDPFAEVQRILEVANSPYEEDNGTNRNTEKTWEGRVLVINRYDWTTYDSRGTKSDDDDSSEVSDYANYACLVDYQKAASKDERSWCTHDETTRTLRGTRMELGGEYSFGRFGLVPDRSAVQSFLFFTAETPLGDETVFRGDDRPIYKRLTDEERHAKRLAIPGSYSGHDFLRGMRREGIPQTLVGPLNVTLMEFNHIAPVLAKANPRAPTIEPQLQEEVVQLLNETMCSWVKQLVAAATDTTTSSLDEFHNAAFPLVERTGRRSKLDELLIERMTADGDDNDNDDKPMELNSSAFAELAGSPTHKLFQFYSIAQLTRGVQFMLGEVCELAGNCALDNRRFVVVPSDVRISIANDEELFNRLGQAKYFYPQDMWQENIEN